ncbi:MAG: prefoldin subunit [Nanoarchaeota archaeon]
MSDEMQARMMEQAMQSYAAQKQQLQGNLLEVESATRELQGASVAYRIIGNIMVEKKAQDVLAELAEKKDRIQVRIAAIDKQQERFKRKEDSP